MRVNVATANPVKLRAAAGAFREFFPGARVSKVRPPKGPQLPRGLARTRALARRRAKSAFRGCDWSVGIESGLWGGNLATVCVLYDGRRFAEGMGPAFRLPWKVPPGRTLEGLFGAPGLGRGGGAIGILSRGRVDRAHITRDAVLMALVASISRGC